MEKISTPGVTTIAALAEFLGIDEAATVKALVGKDEKGQVIAVFIPGDHELNEIKIDRVFAGFQLLDDEELEATGLPKGSIGPVGVPEGIIVAADQNLEKIARWVVGANEDGFHYVGAAQGEDFKADVWADLSTAKAGDICPNWRARRSKKRVVSRFRRSSSLAISIPKRSARSILQKMVPTSHSSWLLRRGYHPYARRGSRAA